ncbi:holin [Variovorax sp. J22G73]|uniref:holin n=1 Tax=unclassified Variovorax TaxID=663243 RepID=UPI002575FB56|nr:MULTISPECIES: holin [unclassified Variovorax]MDM0006435.1 holin [Variovorax sp. J22R203]MDM0097542.1 holin [Variovorax sp. J22G73]
MTPFNDIWKALAVLAGIGVFIAIGKLLVSDEKFSWRLAIGRSIVSAGLAVAAGSIVAFIPGVSMLGIVGLAAATAVLGEQFLERLIHEKVTGGA